MDNIAKKRFKKYYDQLFVFIQKNAFFQKVKKLNLLIRIVIFIICCIWFVVGTLLLPPLPFGNIALIAGLVIVFPLGKVKSKLKFIFDKLRIIKFYAKRLSFKYKIKFKFFSKEKNLSPVID